MNEKKDAVEKNRSDNSPKEGSHFKFRRPLQSRQFCETKLSLMFTAA
jgi:hypothetical protein